MNLSFRHAVIMAAGRGQRMMPLTETVPKPLASFKGTTLVGHSIAQIKRHVEHIHVTVGYKAAEVATHLIEVGVRSVINTEGHSNSWWLTNSVLALIAEPVFVMTCDNVSEIDFDKLVLSYYDLGEPACMLVPVAPIPGIEGDYIQADASGHVTGLSRTEKSRTYASGIQVINPWVVNHLICHGESFQEVWDDLIKARELVVSPVSPRAWFSVDTVSDLERLRERP